MQTPYSNTNTAPWIPGITETKKREECEQQLKVAEEEGKNRRGEGGVGWYIYYASVQEVIPEKASTLERFTQLRGVQVEKPW